MFPSQTHPVKLAFSQFTSYFADPDQSQHPSGANSSLDKARESAAHRIPTVRNLRHLTWRARTLEPAKQFHQALLAAFGDNLDPSVDKIFCRPEQPKLKGVPADPPPEAHALNPAAYPRGQPRLGTWRIDARRRIGVPADPVPIVIWPGHQRPRRGRR